MERFQERGIFRKDIVNAIVTGEIIEDYSDDFPFPSCLVLGKTTRNNPLHVVCGCNGEIIKVVTAYYPTEDKFDYDLKTREEK